MNKRISIGVLISGLLLTATASWALPFTLTPKGTLPTEIVLGETVYAYYTVQNNVDSITGGNLLALPKDVYQVNNDVFIKNICDTAPFDLKGKDECVLKLEVRGKVSASSPIAVCLADGVTCTYTNADDGNTLNVNTKTVQMAYIADAGDLQSIVVPDNRDKSFDPEIGGVASCIMGVDGEIDSCAYSADPTIVVPVDVIVNKNSTPPVAYVANLGDSNSTGGYLSVCGFEQQGQLVQLVNCQLFYDKNIEQPNGLQLSPDGKRLYVTNPIIRQLQQAYDLGKALEVEAIGNSIVICNVQANGNLSSPCAAEQTELQYPTSVWIEGDVAYLANGDSDSIAICSLNTGILDDCVDYSDTSFSYPIDILVNTFVDPPVAYVANDNSDAMSTCLLDPIEGLGTCTTFSGGIEYFDFGDSGLQLSPDGEWLYATNGTDNSVTVCELDAEGSIVSCRRTANGADDNLDVPEGRIAFTLVDSQYYAYIANYSGDTVSYCEYSSADGSLSGCTATDDIFDGPLSVAIQIDNAIAYLYVITQDTLFICSINTDGSITDANCQASDAFNTINNENDIVNIFVSSDNVVYIPNDINNSVSICQAGFNTATPAVWTLTSCNVWASVSPIGRVAFATFGQQLYAYVADYFGTVNQCPVDIDGTFGECLTLTDNNGFLETFDGNFYSLDFNADKSVLFIAAYGNEIDENLMVVCELDAVGDLEACVTPYEIINFDTPASNIFMRNNNNVLYLPDIDKGNVFSCYPRVNSCSRIDFFFSPASVWTARF